ncbi:hypothetical protein HYH02_009247 [Chlamydomonas schloesseri]|nr:hypothetical protein HYH02_009247 [Chlamydomonas schloesseri]|eukprot:KAG2444050.1 hypothetical protein HYH02_009247 [Chlamydomonas schloesseri]
MWANQGHAFITWDLMVPAGYNGPSLYYGGSRVLLHELFHHLGLLHPFGPGNDDDDAEGGSARSCSDDDYVSDTPGMLGSAYSSNFYSTAVAYCMERFWETYGGDWEATYARWSGGLGTPQADMNAWADSCPTKAGYDLLGNYMTYNTPVCFAALGHFTRGQAEMAHYVTAELNPIIYAWGQYYAAVSPSPPPQSPPPPEARIDPCNVTQRSCACKQSWDFYGDTYSSCSVLPGNEGLWCEVLDQTSCPDCAGNKNRTVPCVRKCSGTEWMCKKRGPRPPPPPPLPPSPPPTPPPPPPRAVPDKCKVTSNGCKCRNTWQYNGKYWSGCASPDGDKRLWCQVEPSCPDYGYDSYLFYCDRSLTLDSCRVQPVSISQTRSRADPPPAPPPPPANAISGSSSSQPPPPARKQPSSRLPPRPAVGVNTSRAPPRPRPPAQQPRPPAAQQPLPPRPAAQQPPPSPQNLRPPASQQPPANDRPPPRRRRLRQQESEQHGGRLSRQQQQQH